MPLPLTATRLKRRRTKIVATLGPASNSQEAIASLVAAGVNVFRLNMSHGSHADHRRAAEFVRQAAAASGAQVALLADLCGPKIRVGTFADGGIDLVAGETVCIRAAETGGEHEGVPLIPSQYPSIAADVAPGHRILLDDGQLGLRVERVDGDVVVCEVVTGGRLSDRKGMNLPDGDLSVPALTDKDRADARFAHELGVEFIALSFVCRAEDIVALREELPATANQQIVAKIERPQALDNIDAILGVTDAIMVARGDLGVELPPESLPGTQDALVDLARKRQRPVIIATQMLDSMIRNPRPTRAEVADIAHAVQTGADAVMLSGETAVGSYPVPTVEMMDLTIRHAEDRLWTDGAFRTLTEDDSASPPMPTNVALSRSVSSLSRDLAIRTILVVSRSGTSVRVLSASRPAAPVLAATADAIVCRQFALCWGVVPIPVSPDELEDSVALMRSLARDLDLAQSGHSGLIVRGFRDDPQENQPSVTVVRL